MSDATGDPIQDPVGLAPTLRRTGRCVMRMGHIVLDLEHHLLEGTGGTCETLGSHQSLQALDVLKQTADDLAALLDRLADAVPENITVGQHDILQPMKLQELRDAITGMSDVTRPDVQLKPHQEVELF